MWGQMWEMKSLHFLDLIQKQHNRTSIPAIITVLGYHTSAPDLRTHIQKMRRIRLADSTGFLSFPTAAANRRRSGSGSYPSCTTGSSSTLSVVDLLTSYVWASTAEHDGSWRFNRFKLSQDCEGVSTHSPPSLPWKYQALPPLHSTQTLYLAMKTMRKASMQHLTYSRHKREVTLKYRPSWPLGKIYVVRITLLGVVLQEIATKKMEVKEPIP
ncbi:uncharacterized protein LOC115072313 [Nannospalax galili]|uniref:uncharacterized protein LOC115072313 n=1 Tax=Nannospalax galili TaxID=1026970 RepID=UPI00111BFA75|nr:uncharacterized protein LOC115072313 [Nannospalax galili]